jgi:peptidoglycan/xylan/chitin deacetylase (PgdA/CDA1 family)
VPTKWIGQENHFAADTACFPLAIVDEDDLRMAARLGIAVESHGHAHIDLGQADPLVVAEDLRASVARLREILGRRPRYLAYPYGRQTPGTWASVTEAGFSRAFLIGGVEAGKFAQERVGIDGREGCARLWLKTAGGYAAGRQSRLGNVASSITRLAFPKAHVP